MAILVDFNQVAISNIMVMHHGRHKVELTESLLRHMVLMGLKSYKKKFSKKYGELVICTEGKSWRREVFPLYKAGRGKSDSGLDWEQLYGWIETIKNELIDNFPYAVVNHPRGEADDVVATLTDLLDEETLIVSGDRDFLQLQSNPRVHQYDPVHKKKEIIESNPEAYLAELIIRGCGGDGIPNILSEEDTFVVEGKRQKPINAKKLSDLLSEIPKEHIHRYEMNRKLVDFKEIPQDIKDEIAANYKQALDVATSHGRKNLFNFFINKSLGNLMSEIQFF